MSSALFHIITFEVTLSKQADCNIVLDT